MTPQLHPDTLPFLQELTVNNNRPWFNDHKDRWIAIVDRHESLGLGMMGTEFFERFMHDPRFDNMPIILETPAPTRWAEEIKWLRSL